jgi:hypothetical protein
MFIVCGWQLADGKLHVLVSCTFWYEDFISK